jgi:uncharacterized protein (DUF2225 family)
MKPPCRARWLALASLPIVLAIALPALAITTVRVKVRCPVCGTENDFFEYASWGSYIYQYPSKFQLVFWPHTWSASVYSCKKCHLSLFMWDFKDFPKDKIESAKKLLEGVPLRGDYQNYTDIPVSEKLLVAEKVYQLMNRDDDFWSHFYRVLGYHFAEEKKPEQAKQARLHALEITQRMLADSASAGRRKELLFLAASMHHFTGDDTTARQELKTAAALTYRDPQGDEERSKNYDAYLSALIKEFIPAIEQNKVPEGFEQ